MSVYNDGKKSRIKYGIYICFPVTAGTEMEIVHGYVALGVLICPFEHMPSLNYPSDSKALCCHCSFSYLGNSAGQTYSPTSFDQPRRGLYKRIIPRYSKGSNHAGRKL